MLLIYQETNEIGAEPEYTMNMTDKESGQNIQFLR